MLKLKEMAALPRVFRRKTMPDLPTPQDDGEPGSPLDDRESHQEEDNQAQAERQQTPQDDEAKSDSDLPRTESESSHSSIESFTEAAPVSSSRFGRVYRALNRGIHMRNSITSAGEKRPSRSESLVSDLGLPDVGSRVSTHFGLGTVSDITEHGSLMIPLLGFDSVVLYVCNVEEVQVIPALPNELVTTVNGKARVVSYDAAARKYVIALETDDNESETCVALEEVSLCQEPRQSRAPSMLYQAVASVASACGTIRTTSTELTSSTFSTLGYGSSTRFYRGQLVVTPYGGGTIMTPGSTTRPARVRLSFGATAYLTNDMILGHVKAIEGNHVKTKFGTGRVVSIRPGDSIYCVRLDCDQREGESNVVYAPASDVQVYKPTAKSGVGAAAASATSCLGSFSKGVKDRLLPMRTKVRVAGGYI